jgi:renalase
MTLKNNGDSAMKATQHFAVIGAGMAGVACARTLMQAGHQVTLVEKSRGAGGRMATRDTEFGSFDHGAQYFTVRDTRFERALQTVPGVCRPWSANAVRVLDPLGRVVAAALPAREPHWVATPGMNALVRQWAEPLQAAGRLLTETRVSRIARDALNDKRWQLHTEGADGARHVYSGFDAVLLAIPAEQAHELLRSSQLVENLAQRIGEVQTAPCWTLLAAFPQAMQPGLSTLGPQWNAARSTHHRIAWVARENSKPRRGPIERWTVQAGKEWSQEHLEDDPERVLGKLLKAFAEVTGIRAEPSLATVHRWRYAQTLRPLGESHLWHAHARIGVCGDWCLGHRVEDAFVSGLELALAAL